MSGAELGLGAAVRLSGVLLLALLLYTGGSGLELRLSSSLFLNPSALVRLSDLEGEDGGSSLSLIRSAL